MTNTFKYFSLYLLKYEYYHIVNFEVTQTSLTNTFNMVLNP